MAAALRRGLVLTLSLLLVAASACGDDDAVSPDPELSDLVGDWDATELVLTSVDNPELTVDVIELGATFFLNIQPSGGYTSSLLIEGVTATELGHVELEGDRLIFFVEVAPTGPRVDTARIELEGDRLELEGRTVFDFGVGALGEEAELEAVLVR